MKVSLVIATLRSGGAERQICTLAVQLKRLGAETTVVTYAPGDFYLPLLEQEGIVRRHVPTTTDWGYLRRILPLRSALRGGTQDVVMAFDFYPCLYSELAALPWRKWGLVVSERLATAELHRRRYHPRLLMHLAADYLTTNSHCNRLQLARAVPRLADRMLTIYNAVDLDAFSPPALPIVNSELRLVAAAGYDFKKNMQGLIAAMALLRQRPHAPKVTVDWYGAIRFQSQFDEARRLVEEHHLGDCFRLHDENPCIAEAYRAADAVVLPSFYEGLPNTVCEGMACGKPILCSAVSDAGNLVHDGENGFLFDPHVPAAMAEAMEKLADLDSCQRTAMGRRSRERAEDLFAPAKIAAKYLDLLTAAAQRRRVALDHWPATVPETARAALR